MNFTFDDFKKAMIKVKTKFCVIHTWLLQLSVVVHIKGTPVGDLTTHIK